MKKGGNPEAIKRKQVLLDKLLKKKELPTEIKEEQPLSLAAIKRNSMSMLRRTTQFGIGFSASFRKHA